MFLAYQVEHKKMPLLVPKRETKGVLIGVLMSIGMYEQSAL